MIVGPENETTADRHETKSIEQSSSYKYYVLFILTLIYASNYADRMLVTVVSPSLKEEFDLSDTQLGFLKGLAFALFYSTLSMPIGWLAARWNRVNIVSVSLALWSGFTTLAAFSGNFVQLLLTRMGVGIGEAGGIAPSQTIISDYFPEKERARAFGIFMLAVCLGDCISLLIGGWVLQEFGWRFVFLIVGVPGILLAAILKLTVKEPIRGAVDGTDTATLTNTDARTTSADNLSFIASVSQLLRIPVYRCFVIAFSAALLTTNTLSNWDIDFFTRGFGLQITQITTPMAVISIISFAIGANLGGYISDKTLEKTKASYGLVPGIGMVIYTPLILAFIFAPSAFWAFFFFGALSIAIGVLFGPSYAAVQSVVPLHLRTLASSIMIAAGYLIGIGIGPLIIGIISDLMMPSLGSTMSLKLALSFLSVTSIASAFYYFKAGKMIAENAA